MPEQPDWASLILAARQRPQSAVKAITYRRSWNSACQAVQVTCDDGRDYVIKGANTGRSAYNDQVVGRIAAALGSPVAAVGLIDVAPDLISINPVSMGHITPGLAHGSLVVADCTPSEWFRFVDLPENRPRFAGLALLFGWMVGAEKQFFYSTNPPQVVYSFDHEGFFHRGPNWTTDSLNSAPYATEDDTIVNECGLRPQELREALHFLERISPEVIATAIGATPAEWGEVSDAEQIALADHLWQRRGVLWSNL